MDEIAAPEAPPPEPIAQPEDPTAVPPNGWEKTPPNEAWKRVLREQRARAKAEADAATLRRQIEDLTGKTATLEKGASEVAALRAELEAERAARAKAEQKIPLIRAGIEDDEIGELAADRYHRSQSAVAEDARLDFGSWLKTEGPNDKILKPHLQKQAAAAVAEPPKPAPNATKGTASTAATTATAKLTWEQARGNPALEMEFHKANGNERMAAVLARGMRGRG